MKQLKSGIIMSFEELQGRRAYNIWDNELYPGPRWLTDPVISATANLREASDIYKLAIAALVEGECGSAGLEARLAARQ